MKTCLVNNCSGKGIKDGKGSCTFVYGYCGKHYARLRRTGDIDIVRKRHNGFLEEYLAGLIRKETTNCIEWCEQKIKGYGALQVDGRKWLAHRYVLFLRDGKDSEVVMHTCDNPPCVNYKHLLRGTRADNMADMRNKNRGYRKISDLHIKEIRTSNKTNAELAKDFRITPANVGYIRRKITWKDI